MALLRIIAKSPHHLGTLFKLTKSFFAAGVLIVYIILFKYRKIKKTLNQSETVFIFSLSIAQIDAFKSIIRDKKFLEDFSISLIRDAGLIIIDAQNNFYMEINKKIVIGSTLNRLILIPFLLVILRISFQHIIRSTFAERVNMFAAKSNLNVFVTNSFVGLDPYNFSKLPNKKFATHCAHYSENSVGIGVGEALRENLDHLNPKWLAEEPSDYQWVWSEEYAKYIRKINSRTKVNVVGFVSFDHLPKKPVFNIALFNITPFTLGTYETTHPLHVFKNSQKFILDVLKVTETIIRKNSTIEFVVHLKPKRAYQKSHSSEYTKFLKDLENQNKLILEHHSLSPYELVSNSDLVISTPFTTASQVGKNMGIPSVYYNYLSEDIYYPINTSVRLLKNYQELFDYVDKLVYKKILNINRVKIY